MAISESARGTGRRECEKYEERSITETILREILASRDELFLVPRIAKAIASEIERVENLPRSTSGKERWWRRREREKEKVNKVYSYYSAMLHNYYRIPVTERNINQR